MGAVEPREDQDILSHPQVPQPLLKFWLEDEPRFRRALVALLRRVLAIDELTWPIGMIVNMRFCLLLGPPVLLLHEKFI
jgi:hypothetical protein